MKKRRRRLLHNEFEAMQRDIEERIMTDDGLQNTPIPGTTRMRNENKDAARVIELLDDIYGKARDEH